MSAAPLHESLELTQIADCDVFTGIGQPTPWGRLYGGQVLAQSLGAAQRTVPADQKPHSCHGYFLLEGKCGVEVLFEVERVRDGRSFSTRLVKALQHGKVIFQLSVSFHRDEESRSFQARSEDFMALARARGLEEIPLPDKLLKTRRTEPVISSDLAGDSESVVIAEGPSWKLAWCRYKQLKLPANLHYAALAWASDANFGRVVGGAGYSKDPSEIAMMMSLDHSIHFHRAVRVDEWLLFFSQCSVYAGGRGFGRTEVFTQQGVLVATINQEVLVRPKLDRVAQKAKL